MKKIILSLVAVLSMSVSVNAANSGDTDRNAMNSLEKVLNLDGYQSKVTEQAGQTLQDAFQTALQNTDEQARKQEMKRAVTRNLRSVRGSLDYSQYKKYLQLMNVTLQNRGLLEYVR